MFDDLEQERPLDRIVRVGLARMDAAVEGVIAKHSAPAIDQQWSDEVLSAEDKQNRPRYEFAKVAPISAATRDALSLNEALFRGQREGLLGSPDHCSAGMAAQMSAGQQLGGLLGDPDYQSWVRGRQGI